MDHRQAFTERQSSGTEWRRRLETLAARGPGTWSIDGARAGGAEGLSPTG